MRAYLNYITANLLRLKFQIFFGTPFKDKHEIFVFIFTNKRIQYPQCNVGTLVRR